MWRWMAAVLVLSGCPQTTGLGDAGDASVPLADPLTAHCEALAAADCAWQRRCGEASTEVPCPPSWSDCAALQRPLVTAQMLTFDAAVSAECVAAVAQGSCQYRPSSGPLCREAFVGTGGPGDRCGRYYFDHTCAGGLECFQSSPGCGVCRVQQGSTYTYPVLGEPCLSPAVDGLGCARGFVCLNARCELPKGLGDACGNHVCDVGLRCVAADGGAVCQRYSELGEPCATQSPQQRDCKWGLRCEAGACAALLADGEACTDGFDCVGGRCVDAACAPRFAELGESCSSGSCDWRLRCAPDATCVTPIPVGAPCSQEMCEAGASCENGTCRNQVLECQ